MWFAGLGMVFWVRVSGLNSCLGLGLEYFAFVSCYRVDIIYDEIVVIALFGVG